MRYFYLDTSAVLKRYRTEKGTDVVDEIYSRRQTEDAFFTSHFTCLEVESVAARALKGRLLTRQAYEALLGSFARDLREYLLFQVSGDLINSAVESTRNYALRAADSLHFAAAATWVAVVGDDFIFVASDKELLSAAKTAGVSTRSTGFSRTVSK
jgi:predicted nucleic acid-binding protein